MNEIVLGILVGLFIVMLVAFFCISLIRLYIHKIKNYTKVIYQKDLDFQKALNDTIVETQEQVLNNISQDLHDDAGQQLTYINFQLENLKLDSAELHNLLEPLSESVSNLSSSIRRISHSLNSQLLLQQNLLKAIEGEVTRLQKNGAETLQYLAGGKSQKEFSSNEKIIIYRIFQEIINNSFKHSGATSINIFIAMNPSFEMAIADNGKGFEYPKINANEITLGLQNMMQRAAIINYKLDIQSAIGHGTTITLSENKNT